jgi:hypothetical protein
MEPAPVMPSARQRARVLREVRARRLAPVRSGRLSELEEDHSREKPSGLALWWPILVGIALAFAAPRLWILIQTPWGELGPRVVFPYLLLLARPEVGLSHELANNLSQLMIYLQFPLEGLVVTWGMARGGSFSKAFAQVAFLHGLGILVLWLLSQPLTAP